MTLAARDAPPKAHGDRIAVLDGFRALAILSVLSFHYTVRWAPPRDPQGHFPAGAIFNGLLPFEYGWLGVEFFFVISGFVILMTLERCRGLGDFVLRRFARLWPALLVAASLTTMVVFVTGPAEWRIGLRDYMTSISLIDPRIASRLLQHPGIKWVDGAYWSLWAEIRFYVAAAIVYLTAGKNFIKFWLVFQAGVVAAQLMLHLAHAKTFSALLSVVAFPAYLPYFTLGVCIYEIYSRGALSRLAAAGAAMACAIILASAALGRTIFAGEDALVCMTANLIMFGLFFLFVIDHPLLGIFKRRPLVALGQASYSLYLIHQIIGVAIMRRGMEWGMPYFLVLSLTVCAIIAAAFLLSRLVEVPAKSWLLRQTRNWTAIMDRRMPWLRYNPDYGPDYGPLE